MHKQINAAVAGTTEGLMRFFAGLQRLMEVVSGEARRNDVFGPANRILGLEIVEFVLRHDLNGADSLVFKDADLDLSPGDELFHQGLVVVAVGYFQGWGKLFSVPDDADSDG